MKVFIVFWLLAQPVLGQSIWTADFIQSKPGRQPHTLRYFEQNWSAARQLAQQAGYVKSYQLFQVQSGLDLPDKAKGQAFDFVLLTQYPSEAVYAQREANFAKIFKNLPTRLPDGVAPVDMRDIRFSKNFTDPFEAQDKDLALEATLMDYLDGGTNGDTTRLIRAFHPSASMKYIDNATGQFRDVPIGDYLNRAKAGAGKKTERTTRIVQYEKTGTAAQARVESDYPTFRFIDYFNLLQINGRWQIVSKIFYRQDKSLAK